MLNYLYTNVVNSHYFQIGLLYAVDNLDYEQVQHYTLTVRATDSVSGVSAEVLVSIMVTDANDCAPEFFQDSYNISISESASFGSFILRVTATDNDTGNTFYEIKLKNILS